MACQYHALHRSQADRIRYVSTGHSFKTICQCEYQTSGLVIFFFWYRQGRRGDDAWAATGTAVPRPW
eukprot:3939327-Rhodomonas_salina.1